MFEQWCLQSWVYRAFRSQWGFTRIMFSRLNCHHIIPVVLEMDILLVTLSSIWSRSTWVNISPRWFTYQWLTTCILFRRLLKFTNLLIPQMYVIWTKHTLLLLFHRKRHSILNYIMSNSLTSHFKPIYRRLLISITPFSYQITLVLASHFLRNQMIIYQLILIPLPYINHSSLQFFFIRYIPEDNTKPRWFLVQVNHIESEILKMDFIAYRRLSCYLRFSTFIL